VPTRFKKASAVALRNIPMLIELAYGAARTAGIMAERASRRIGTWAAGRGVSNFFVTLSGDGA